jgi:hypothetical protein
LFGDLLVDIQPNAEIDPIALPSGPLTTDYRKPCDNDQDGDCDSEDFDLVSKAIGKCEGDSDYNEPADGNRDGCVTTEDLGMLFPDLDGDGVADVIDNCPAVQNPDQVDADGDGVGDLCNPTIDLLSFKDSFLRDGADNTNEGANPLLRIQASGHNRAVVAFDLSGIDTTRVTSATLILTIVENADNWGQNNNRTVSAHPLLVDFTEGNGKNAEVPRTEVTRGSGPGVTWACATDSEITNPRADCTLRWNGGMFGPATALPVVHTNGQHGEVEWDVTADVQTGATRWVIKKTNEGQSGRVAYSSKEGTAPPQLILTLK